MKILYIHQYFKTPQEGGAIRSYYIAKGMVDQGFEVVMITAHNESEYRQAEIEGITIHYLPVVYRSEMRSFQRIRSFMRFVRKTKKLVPSLGKFDLVYATSTPLSVGLIARWIQRKYKVSYYFEVRDLWPTAPIALGTIKGGFLKKKLYQLEARIYQHADKIVALSPGMQEWIEKVVPSKEIHVIPNMADCEFFKMEQKDPKLLEFYHVTQPFVITYFGSIGMSNHLEFFLELAREASQEKLGIDFKIVGAGSQLSNIKRLSYTKKLTNVEFIPYQNKEGVKDILNITDATYTCFANIPILSTNSPNKLFDSLAAGKLTIVNTPGWTKDLVTSNQCGFYTDPLNPKDFIEKIKPFLSDRTLLETYMRNARRTAEIKYSRKSQVNKLISILKNEYPSGISDAEAYTLTA